MKTLMAYYSFEGNTAYVAEEVKQFLEEKGNTVDLYEIKAKKNPPKNGFFKFAAGGFYALTQMDPGIESVKIDINSYDQLIIGMPIWASNPPGAIKAFIKQAAPKGRDCLLIACSGGGNSGKTFDKVKGYLSGNKVIGTLDIAAAKAHPDVTWDKLASFLNDQ